MKKIKILKIGVGKNIKLYRTLYMPDSPPPNLEVDKVRHDEIVNNALPVLMVKMIAVPAFKLGFQTNRFFLSCGKIIRIISSIFAKFCKILYFCKISPFLQKV